MIKKGKNFIISLGIALGIYSNVIGNSYSLINNKIKSEINLKPKQNFSLGIEDKKGDKDLFDIKKYLSLYNYENSYFYKKKDKERINDSHLTNLLLYEKPNRLSNVLEESKDNKNLDDNLKLTNTNSFNKLNKDYKIEDLNQDDETTLLARMILGEGEGCSRLEKIAIGYTAINRAKDNKKWNGTTIKEALSKEYQYESLNNKKRLEILKNPLAYNKKEFLESLEIAEKIIKGVYKDPTKGATHFYNPRSMKRPPKWANSKSLHYIGKVEKNGYHLFYREK